MPRTTKHGQRAAFVDLDTSSVKSKQSQQSAVTSQKGRKKTRVLGGHGMPIRDSRTG